MKRRTFMQSTCCGGLLALVGGSILPACRERQIQSRHSNTPGSMQRISHLSEETAEILYYASLAPSTHNTQPWTVRLLDSRTWIIEADQSRSLPAVDPDNRELLLSLGAFAENLAVAAGASGLQAEFEVLARDRFERDILTVVLKPGPSKDFPLKSLERRQTVRNGLQNRPLRDNHVQELASLLPDHFFYFPRASEHAGCLARGTAKYFRIQSYRDETQTELTRWLRLNPKSANKNRDGLTLQSMGINGLKAWFMRHFVKPEDFLKASFREKGVEAVSEQTRQGGGWIVLTSQDNSVGQLIETGRAFQRIALKACERNIGLHPMSQYLEEAGGKEDIRSEHRPELRPQFLIRAGYVSEFPEPVSPRRPVGWFVRS